MTVTVNEQFVMPRLLEAMQLTVVMPTGKKEPEAGTHDTVTQLPLMVGAGKFTTVPHWPGVLVTVTLEGQVRVHGAATWLQAENSEVLLLVSVAVAVMIDPAAGKLAEKPALPFASVSTLVEPIKVFPSPKPLGSQEAFAKNSRRKVLEGVLFKVP